MAEITLRAIEKDDLPLLQQWRNSLRVMPYCRQYRPLSVEDMLGWYENLTKDKEFNLLNDLFIIERYGVPIGVGGYVRIDWRNRKAELSFYVGENKEFTEKDIVDALLVLLDYADKTLNLHKVYWPVYSFHPHLKIYEKCLKREYVAKKEYYWQGKYWDRVILTKYFNGERKD